MTKPLLLLDVDGVLNCFGSIWSEEYEALNFEPLRVFHKRFTIRIPNGTGQRLASLAESFDMVWCTAWQEEAHPFFGPQLELGDPWPVIEFSGWDGRLHEGRSWKWSFVDRYVDVEGRMAAWVDDDLHAADFAWAADRTMRVAPTMLVKTNQSIGLTDTHVAHLRSWATAVTREAA